MLYISDVWGSKKHSKPIQIGTYTNYISKLSKIYSKLYVYLLLLYVLRAQTLIFTKKFVISFNWDKKTILK